MKRIVITLIFVLSFSALNALGQSTRKAKVLSVSSKVISALKARDMKRLAAFVHPSKGVRFAPFSEITTDYLVFKREQVPALLKSRKIYLWGYMDESERPIKTTFAGYYRKFVYDHDFARPDEINYNTKRNVGIMINNIAKMYPRGVEVEYFFEGTDDMMYGCLRLVYEQLRGQWYLVAVVRDTPGI